jgi:hypothetical protein
VVVGARGSYDIRSQEPHICRDGQIHTFVFIRADCKNGETGNMVFCISEGRRDIENRGSVHSGIIERLNNADFIKGNRVTPLKCGVMQLDSELFTVNLFGTWSVGVPILKDNADWIVVAGTLKAALYDIPKFTGWHMICYDNDQSLYSPNRGPYSHHLRIG